MTWKSMALGLALALVAVLPAAAQRGGGGNWELLGEGRVGIGADRDVIRLGHEEGYFRSKSYRRLRFIADGGEVRMRSIRLVYLNGYTEDFSFEQNMAPGQEIDMDLRGERSYLRQIEMFYKAKFGISIGGGGVRIAQPIVRVYGENVRAAPPPRPVPPPAASGVQWDTLGRERFDRRDERVEFRVGREKGRFEVIRLQLAGTRVFIRDVVVRFANGTSQSFRLNQPLSHEEVTPTLDLQGEVRTIERVIVNLEPRRRPGGEILGLAGGVRGGVPGGPGPGHGRLVPLGQTEVGFRVDRDVIRVGQSEDWFRNRGFDKLHFQAENNDVHMMSIRIVYLNGFAEDYSVDRLIRAGGDLAIDLRGRRSYIREIEMLYRKRPGFAGRAIVRVLGEPPR